LRQGNKKPANLYIELEFVHEHVFQFLLAVEVCYNQLGYVRFSSQFLKESEEAGLLALKGHRSVGGMRASIYNAMPEAGVDSLIEFMELFEKDQS
jgi:phosphoserine aminotransferase